MNDSVFKRRRRLSLKKQDSIYSDEVIGVDIPEVKLNKDKINKRIKVLKKSLKLKTRKKKKFFGFFG